ncbi:MAG: LarC family nickel insertion protein [Candidatus Omnitrophica bacterium]|nr:LarC family nickel insertion protein [Candidatus Omnitrophota bacterium]
MKNIYFQLAGGAAGDMLLYSLIGLGCPLSYLKKELKKLKINLDITLKEIKNSHHSNKCLEFKGELNLSYFQIVKLISKSKLEKDIKKKALKSYKELFEIERKIHKAKAADFKFHHLGKLDAILEICGFYIALKYLDVSDIFVSDFPLSMPSAAALSILKGKKINARNLGYESVTPTAAILLKGASELNFDFNLEKYSIAFGKCKETDYLIAYLMNEPAGVEKDKIIKIEANIDDMNPQIFEDVFEKLYACGAKEAYVEQVVMKKSRPAFVLNVLCVSRDFEKIRNIIFSHTTTFGLRYSEYLRDKLKYNFILKKTRFGKIRFRVACGTFKKETPEYEDCRKIARKLNIPLSDIYRSIW